MTSLVHIIGYFILIGTVVVCDNNELVGVKQVYPFYFGYYIHQRLNMMIYFKNVGSNVNITLKSNTDLREETSRFNGTQSFHIHGSLINDKVIITAELHTRSGKCATKTITEGVNLSKFVGLYSEHCSYFQSPCKIEVDLKEQCGGNFTDVQTIKYGLTKDVLFDCREYSNITEDIKIYQNDTKNRISKFNKQWITIIFNKADNGSTLYCLVSIYKDYGAGNKYLVEELIAKKTILIYDDSLDSGTSVMLDIFIYSMAVSVAILIVTLIILIFIKKCYRKTPRMEESMQLDTCTSHTKIVYADLKFTDGDKNGQRREETEQKKQDEQVKKQQDEECTYAEIVGVMHPF